MKEKKKKIRENTLSNWESALGIFSIWIDVKTWTWIWIKNPETFWDNEI